MTNGKIEHLQFSQKTLNTRGISFLSNYLKQPCGNRNDYMYVIRVDINHIDQQFFLMMYIRVTLTGNFND